MGSCVTSTRGGDYQGAEALAFQDPLSSFRRWDLLPFDAGAN